MRICFRIFIVGILFFSGAFTRAELANGIYAIVNDAVITYQEVEQTIAPLVDLLQTQYGDHPEILQQKIQQTRTEKIEELVTRQLILNEFKTAGYQLPESIVDDVLRERIRRNFGDRATLTKTLQAQGVTYETFRKEQREQIIVEELTRKNISSEKILISPHKIEAYYAQNRNEFKLGDQIKLRMIVLNKDPDNSEATQKLAQEILTKIEAGTPFAEMASIYSEGSQRAQGGDRGWIERSYFKKELADAAFSLQAGQRSKVIDLPEACYLMLVEDKRAAHLKPLPEVRAEIEARLKTQEHARLQKQWIDRLKNKSFVRYY
ncbi:MAG: peptidylprolyl isomerase [Limisphaerales bacterium]